MKNIYSQYKKEALAYLAAIVESSDDAIISKNLDGVITSWNAAAERIFGYKAEEIIGKHIYTIIPQDRKEEEAMIMEKLRNGERIDHFETKRMAKDGCLLDVSITISPIRDRYGKIIGASKISRDITEKKRIERELQEANQKKEEFIANISHELRTPLNAIIGLVNILKLSEPLTEKQRQYISILKVSSDALLNLINDLLDYAKIKQKSIEFENIEFNLADSIEKIVSMLRVKAEERKLRLSYYYPPSLSKSYIGDPYRIQQVLGNLINNAVKFTESGTIEVKVDGKEFNGKTTIYIQVVDTGIGIEKEKLISIFDKFTQADASITRKYGGSGLGLAISKELVEAMGGTIQVESERGKGSTFTVILPLESSQQHTNKTPQGYSIPSGHAKRDVLLVEDYFPSALVVTELLDHYGYNYDIATNGYEAIKKFNEGNYRVILMDIGMQGLDGLEATKRIREMEKEKRLRITPVIAMTAHIQEKNKQTCIDAGMNDFISKPFEPDEFKSKVQNYIKRDTLQ